MKSLFLHADFLEVVPKKKAVETAEENPESFRVENALVVYVSIEKGDNSTVVEQLLNEIEKQARVLKTNQIVVYPYVHLTQIPADVETANNLLNLIVDRLKERGFNVKKAPFGWYKEFAIKVKGHPLSELSRNIKNIDNALYEIENLAKKVGLSIRKIKNKIIIESKKEEIKKYKKYNKVFLLVYPDGKEYVILGEENNKLVVTDFKEIISNLKDINDLISINLKDIAKNIIKINKETFNKEMLALIDKEVFGKAFEEIEENPIRKAMEKFGFEWESLSDYGHMRYKPYAALMVDLVSEYAIQLSQKLKFPVYIIKGTNMFDLEKGPVAAHAKLYGDRLYELETDKSKFVLRYAACFQQFAIAKDLIISYRNLPFGMLEIADSYRFEQPGEVLLGFRLRKFWMPDLHIFCRNMEEAQETFYYMHETIMNEMKKLNRDYELLINYGSPEFYLKYNYLAKELAKRINKPVLVYIYPPSEGRYWIINIEYHIVDIVGRPREIGTTQIDIGNGKRFGIKYTKEDGSSEYVIILHNAIIGSVERYIYALFDTALRKKKPTLPIWISPVQVRVIPISEKHLQFAEQVVKEIKQYGIRVELDDRNETVSKKIMDAERLWVPYIVVIGDKELQNKILSVRIREKNKVVNMSTKDLIFRILFDLKEYPKKENYWPERLSLRPANL